MKSTRKENTIWMGRYFCPIRRPAPNNSSAILLCRTDFTDLDRVAVSRARHFCSLAGQLVEGFPCGLVGGVERVNFVTHHQRVIRAFADAGAEAGCVPRHHVLGAAHRVAHFASESFALASGDRAAYHNYNKSYDPDGSRFHGVSVLQIAFL